MKNDSDSELRVADLMTFARVVAETVGGGWIMKKIKEDRAETRRFQLASRNRQHAYLYKPQPHPLIGWAIEFERMQMESIESKRLSYNESVLKLSILGKSLNLVRDLPGFAKLVDRLKKRESFFSAAFEAEVAASYCAKGYQVKFVEETTTGRTPDLKVTQPDGTVFWVECKCRDERTERDQRIHMVWQELQKTLLAEMSPMKLNSIVLVKSRHDPERKDIPCLRDCILNAVSSGGCGSYDESSGIFVPVRDPSGRYDVVVKPLNGADEEIEGNGFQFKATEDFDEIAMVMESQLTNEGKHRYKNPLLVALKNAIPSDKVTGIIHGFKSAVGQLPRDQAGVVWIRVPDNAWNSDLDSSFTEARRLVQKEMCGDQNRRVNAVILMTRLFERMQDCENSGLAYRPLIMTIEHPNPRTKVRLLQSDV